MKKCRACNEEKPVAMFNKNKNRADGLEYICKPCAKAKFAEYRLRNIEKLKEKDRVWYQSGGKVKVAANYKKWGEANPDKLREYKRRYWEQKGQETHRIYRAENPDVIHRNNIRRRKNESEQCPIWADQEKIREIYMLAKEFREAGFDVHVDHIVPLAGKKVCGLHVHNNLRVCLAHINMSKNNRFDDSQ